MGDAIEPFRFLDLPLELQLEILRFLLEPKIYGGGIRALGDDGIIVMPKETNHKTITFSTLFTFPRALLLVNSRMNAAAKEVFYHENEWLLLCPDKKHHNLSDYTHSLESPLRSHIRRAHFLVFGPEWIPGEMTEQDKVESMLLTKLPELKKLTISLFPFSSYPPSFGSWSQLEESLQLLRSLRKECDVTVTYMGGRNPIPSSAEAKDKLEALFGR